MAVEFKVLTFPNTEKDRKKKSDNCNITLIRAGKLYLKP